MSRVYTQMRYLRPSPDRPYSYRDLPAREHLIGSDATPRIASRPKRILPIADYSLPANRSFATLVIQPHQSLRPCSCGSAAFTTPWLSSRLTVLLQVFRS